MKLLKLVLSMLAASALTLGAQVQPRQSVGLVLSGGGAKGIAHIGIIQALEDNDIPIDYVTGTSMGAIVGGLYAAGYTPQEMLDMICSRGFSYWSTGKIDPLLTYYFYREQASPSMFSMTLGTDGAPNDVPASLISGQPMSFAFMDLFSAYTAQCGRDFNKLFVPFRCVASDVSAHRKHVFSSGSLGDAIRASMTFPIVFQPIAIDSVYYYDGGIYDNFPVDVMRQDFAPSIMIGVDVSNPSTGAQTSLMDQLEDLIIQGHDPTLPDDEGIRIHVDLHKYSLLDFPKAREIYEVGYQRGLEMIDSIKQRVSSRIPATTRNLRRAVFKSQSPYVRFDRVNVEGGNRRQNEYISYLFRPASGSDTLGISRARDAYYRAIGSGKLRDLFPQAQYNDSTDMFALNLKASVKGNLKGSVGGFISSSTSSFLYAGLNYSTLSFSSLNAGLEGWLGQTTMAAVLNGRMYLHTSLPSAIGAQVVVSREKFYQNEHAFYEDKYPTFIIDYEYFARAFWSVAAGRRGAFDLGAGYGALRNSFYKNNVESTSGRDHSNYNLGQVIARYTASTLDEVTFPTSGYSINATAMGVRGTNHVFDDADSVRINSKPQWAQLEFQTRFYPSLSQHFSLGMEADVMLSTRKLLSTYSASIATAPLFAPTPSAHNAFRAQFRANSFVGVGLIPIYKYSSNLSARLGGYAFIPVRRIIEAEADTPRYGKWLGSAEFFGEADITYHFPFGSLTGYANYSTGHGAEWNFGLSFGVFILPPKFLR